MKIPPTLSAHEHYHVIAEAYPMHGRGCYLKLLISTQSDAKGGKVYNRRQLTYNGFIKAQKKLIQAEQIRKGIVKPKLYSYHLDFGTEEDFKAEAARNLALISIESLDMIEPFTGLEMKDIRSRLGLGQGDFAKLTGHIISRETFTRIENGAEIEAKTTAFIRMCLAYRLPDFSFVDKEKYGRKKVLEYKSKGEAQ